MADPEKGPVGPAAPFFCSEMVHFVLTAELSSQNSTFNIHCQAFKSQGQRLLLINGWFWVKQSFEKVICIKNYCST